MLMSIQYVLKIKYKQLGVHPGLEAIVSNNAEGDNLKIIITINVDLTKKYDQLRASMEFLDGAKGIDNINSVINDKRFCSLIEHYQKVIIDASSRDQLLLNDSRVTHEGKDNIKLGTNLLAELTRSIFSRSKSKTNSTATADLLLLRGYILQKLNVCTSYKICNQKEITIARTYIGYRNLTMFDRKFESALFYLHLANVILANQLILKPATDFITGIENAISHLRRNILLYGFGITAVNVGFNIYYEPTNMFLFILPLIWPIAAFCMRRYGPKIFSLIIRYAINRILKSQNFKNSFGSALDAKPR